MEDRTDKKGNLTYTEGGYLVTQTTGSHEKEMTRKIVMDVS